MDYHRLHHLHLFSEDKLFNTFQNSIWNLPERFLLGAGESLDGYQFA
jgi:hypothetical protein